MSINIIDELYKPSEAAELLGVSPNTIYLLLNSGKLKGFRIGSPWKIPASAIQDFILTNSGLKK